MSMGHTYKFFGFYISYTILTLPLSIFHLSSMLFILCTFPPSPLPSPLLVSHTETLGFLVCLAHLLFLQTYLHANVERSLSLWASMHCRLSSPPQLLVSTPPTSLDECFFNSLVVGFQENVSKYILWPCVYLRYLIRFVYALPTYGLYAILFHLTSMDSKISVYS